RQETLRVSLIVRKSVGDVSNFNNNLPLLTTNCFPRYCTEARKQLDVGNDDALAYGSDSVPTKRDRPSLNYVMNFTRRKKAPSWTITRPKAAGLPFTSMIKAIYQSSNSEPEHSQEA